MNEAQLYEDNQCEELFSGAVQERACRTRCFGGLTVGHFLGPSFAFGFVNIGEWAIDKRHGSRSSWMH